jgi:hypothetical protein
MGSVTGGLSHKKGASHKATKVARRFCRICVDGSSEKPGEYADVSAHVAQLGTFKAQVGSAAELEGTIYSGDWTQAHLFALNTTPQYMAAPRAILSKHTPNGERMCLRLSIHKALYGAALLPACGALAVIPGWHTNYGFRRSPGGPFVCTCSHKALRA